MDYIVTQEEAIITYSNSNMKLAVHSDASYLSEPKSINRACGHYFLSNEATIPKKQRRNSQHRPRNQTRHDIRNRRRTSATIHHDTRSSIHQNNTGINRAQSAASTITNRQRNGRCSMQQKNKTKTKKINEHALPLTQRQRMPKIIQNILATR